jgi:cAMP-specific phosphodiesterase 4
MSYRNNFYHTQIHAADVVQNLVYFIEMCDVKTLCEMTPNDIFFTLLSGAAHDMDHPGTNNMWEIKCRSKLALLYNDQSVLENHHAASFFFLLDNEDLDCIKNLPGKEKLDGRKIILENILGTDMSKHGAIQAEVKAIADLPEDQREMNTKNKAYILKALVHAADIGNPTRPFDIARKWAEKIVSEFFDQGDRERVGGFEISMLCDRHTTNFAKSQIGFLNFVIFPYYNVLTAIIPKLDDLK